jgi:uncharacterized protein YdaU (DUF1376 family)
MASGNPAGFGLNYYERYCGDYARDTRDLSLLEHGVYTLLLDTYYSTERALPADPVRLMRICSAITPEEQAAVRFVADRFFPINGDGMRHNKRADEQIPDAQRRIQSSRENGKKGGNPYLTKQYNEPGFLYAVRLDDERIKVGITSNAWEEHFYCSCRHGFRYGCLRARITRRIRARRRRGNTDGSPTA